MIFTDDKIPFEDVNRPGEFQNSAPITFYNSSRAVLYNAKGKFSSNTCRKLKIENGTKTDKQTTNGGCDKVSLSHDARIRLQIKVYK